MVGLYFIGFFRLKLALPSLTENIQGYRITYFRTKKPLISQWLLCA